MSKYIKMDEAHSRTHKGEEISADLDPYKELPMGSMSGKLFEAFVRCGESDGERTSIHFCALKDL